MSTSVSPTDKKGDSLLDLTRSRPWEVGGRYLPPSQLQALQQQPGAGWKTGNDIICLFRIFFPPPSNSSLFFPFSLLLPRVRKVRKKQESRGAGKEIEGNLPLSP